MDWQRLARFLLWQGFGVIILGIVLLFFMAGMTLEGIGQSGPGAKFIGLCFAIGLIMILIGATIRAIAPEGYEEH